MVLNQFRQTSKLAAHFLFSSICHSYLGICNFSCINYTYGLYNVRYFFFWSFLKGMRLTCALWFFVNDQRDAQFFTLYLFLFLTLYMFRAHRAHHQERYCVNTTSGKNKYIVKNCASRWSFTKNHNTMHGQQNVKLYIVFRIPWRPLTIGRRRTSYNV